MLTYIQKLALYTCTTHVYLYEVARIKRRIDADSVPIGYNLLNRTVHSRCKFHIRRTRSVASGQIWPNSNHIKSMTDWTAGSRYDWEQRRRTTASPTLTSINNCWFMLLPTTAAPSGIVAHVTYFHAPIAFCRSSQCKRHAKLMQLFFRACCFSTCNNNVIAVSWPRWLIRGRQNNHGI